MAKFEPTRARAAAARQTSSHGMVSLGFAVLAFVICFTLFAQTVAGSSSLFSG
jgi:hypothetical protein